MRVIYHSVFEVGCLNHDLWRPRMFEKLFGHQSENEAKVKGQDQYSNVDLNWLVIYILFRTRIIIYKIHFMITKLVVATYRNTYILA